MKTLHILLLTITIAGGSLGARAEQPTAQIRAATERVLAVLQDPALKAEARRSERRRLIRQELDRCIDWTTIARSSLGRHWSKRTSSEQTEYVSVFSRFLANTYLEKLEAGHGELDRIDYLGEKIIDDCASVKVQITTKAQVAHPVEYRLQKSASGWRIYDMLIEGVSVVKNYRDQFDEILAKSSYEKLVADLRARLPAESP